MSTATTTEPTTSPHTTSRATTQPTNAPLSQSERSAANRLRTTMAAVRLAFTWLGVRKTLAPEQRTTAARAFHADRELLSASKLILNTKNPAYRSVAAVRSRCFPGGGTRSASRSKKSNGESSTTPLAPGRVDFRPRPGPIQLAALCLGST
jgi:hypothetical protein